jgi:hypothetical protein
MDTMDNSIYSNKTLTAIERRRPDDVTVKKRWVKAFSFGITPNAVQGLKIIANRQESRGGLDGAVTGRARRLSRRDANGRCQQQRACSYFRCAAG